MHSTEVASLARLLWLHSCSMDALLHRSDAAGAAPPSDAEDAECLLCGRNDFILPIMFCAKLAVLQCAQERHCMIGGGLYRSHIGTLYDRVVPVWAAGRATGAGCCCPQYAVGWAGLSHVQVAVFLVGTAAFLQSCKQLASRSQPAPQVLQRWSESCATSCYRQSH
jgi:hypothetical protein